MDASIARSRPADSMTQACLWVLLPALVLFLVTPSVGNAQVPVVTDITSSGLGTEVQPPSDGVYNITGGTRPGGGLNLFHSFGDFSIGQDHVANFLNDSGLPTSNIIGRVTGGISNIDGTIQTNDIVGGFGNANLFLINPSGIVFGPNGSVNVGGSVSFSTAQYLRLFDEVTGNSANFYADSANDGLLNSVFAMAPLVEFGFLSPAGYGFLDVPNPLATITVQSRALSVDPGQSISLVGGKVIIEDGARLSAPTGRIHLATAATPGEFAALPGESLANATSLQSIQNYPDDPALATSFTSYGLVSLAPGSSINVTGANTVFVKGGQLVLSVNEATLNTSESPAQSDTISLSAGSFFSTSNSGADPGAAVQITVGSLQADGAVVRTINSGDGDGGNISIDATEVGLTNSAIILNSTGLDFTTFENVVSGNGGNITANVGTLSLTYGATIASLNNSLELGSDGGNITANVGTLSLTDGAMITSLNSSLGLGQGGNVTIQGLKGSGSAADLVMLGNDTGASSAISTLTISDSGSGGDVSITAKQLHIENASGVSSETLIGSGVGGDLFLNVGTLTLKGGDLGGSSIRSTNSATGTDLDFDGVPDVFNAVGGKVSIQGIKGVGSAVDTVTLSGSSRIRSDAITAGDGGRVSLAVTSLTMSEASSITSETFERGLGGDIVVSVQKAKLSGEATIASRTIFSDQDEAGAGGAIAVQGLDGTGSRADSLTFVGFRSGIISETFGAGDPGDVRVYAETVSLTGGAVIEAGNPQSTGTGGNVIIVAGSVEIIGSAGFPGTESRISSQASGRDAGQVTITADQLTLDNGSIASSTVINTPGRGGAMVLNVGIVSLTNGATIDSSTAGFGRAGDITMNVGTLSLADGSSISSTSTGAVVTNPDDGTTQVPGRAGNVVITAADGFTSDASTVATSAEANHGGDITISADSVQLSGGSVITANSKAPLVVTKFVLDQDGLPVKVEAVGDDGRSDGNAGNVIITSASNVVMQNSKVTTEASAASGGSIEINASDTGMIQLINSKVSTSVGGVAGSNGGNISIDPQFVVLQNSQIIAQAFAGAGGAINIIATSAFIADPASIVNASSTRGISGTINIQSPLQNIGGELAPLSEEFSSAAALLAQQCAARVADGKFSTFVIAAREGLPAEPGGFLASPSLTTELLRSRLSGRDAQTQLSAVTGLFPKYDAKPIQLAKLGNACR